MQNKFNRNAMMNVTQPIAKLFSSVTLFVILLSFNDTKAQNYNCEYPQFFCQDTTFTFNYTGSTSCTPATLFYWFQVPQTIDSIVMSSPAELVLYNCYGPYASPGSDACGLSGAYASDTGITNSYTITNNDTIAPGYYYVAVQINSCNSSISFEVFGGELLCEPLPCENCIGSFAPEPGKKYVISMWVRESEAPVTKTSFDKPQVSLIFTGSSTVTLGPFTATGQIIDGWQRLEQQFIVPAGATAMEIKLECDSASCFFDDIRIHPYDGSMKTYVFDPVTLRLVAELDERNYATFYEYDEEGKLLRIKKETERGIMTIQESKTSIHKGQ